MMKTNKTNCPFVGDGEVSSGSRDGGAPDVLRLLQPLHAPAPPSRRGPTVERVRRPELPVEAAAAPGQQQAGVVLGGGGRSGGRGESGGRGRRIQLVRVCRLLEEIRIHAVVQGLTIFPPPPPPYLIAHFTAPLGYYLLQFIIICTLILQVRRQQCSHVVVLHITNSSNARIK